MSAFPHPALERTASKSQEPVPTRTGYNLAIGYLRTWTVIMVLAYHTALAYVPGPRVIAGPLTMRPRHWKASAVMDPQRWSGFLIFREFNDTYFMALLFFLSGLFVWNSLRRKGARVFLRDRMLRLGVPFLVGVAILAPLQFYPAYAIRTSAATLMGFVRQWLSLGEWPTGPVWFLWVLLAFDCAAAATFAVAPHLPDRLAEFCSDAKRHPARLFLLLFVASAAAYVPVEMLVGPDAWPSFGIFHFQASRFFHYAVYFSAGVGVGAYGLERGLLASDGELARRWFRWVAAMVAAFALLIAFALRQPLIVGTLTAVRPGFIGGVLFELSCAASCFGYLALFVRFVKRRASIFDTLSDNEYGMYLIHRPIVSWLCYAMMALSISAIDKFALVFIGVLLLSWGSSAAMRRIPAVARII
ncbi:MAG TPA: acyltransferase [Candidatus Binataceae bacterium]|nr:acyltransferase [Candidatus Binataceae bacterium]